MFLSLYCLFFFFFKQKTAYEMRMSDWSSDVCSSDLDQGLRVPVRQVQAHEVSRHRLREVRRRGHAVQGAARADGPHRAGLSGGAHLVPEVDAEPHRPHADRKSVVEGKSVSVRLDLGGRRIIKKKKYRKKNGKE